MQGPYTRVCGVWEVLGDFALRGCKGQGLESRRVDAFGKIRRFEALGFFGAWLAVVHKHPIQLLQELVVVQHCHHVGCFFKDRARYLWHGRATIGISGASGRL